MRMHNTFLHLRIVAYVSGECFVYAAVFILKPLTFVVLAQNPNKFPDGPKSGQLFSAFFFHDPLTGLPQTTCL